MKLMSDSDYRRMHPVAALTGLLMALREFIIPIILFYQFGKGEGTNWFFIIAILLPVFSGIGRWFRFTYRTNRNHLSIKEGLFTQKQVEIPKNRVQSIDISAGLLQRLFGLVTVNLQIAGASESAVTLNAVTKKEADRVVAALRDYDISEPEVLLPVPTHNLIFKLSHTQLLLAGLTSGRFGVILTIILTMVSQLEYFYSVEETVESLVTVEIPAIDLGFSIVLIVFVLFLVTWILAIIGTFITYYAFELYKEDTTIVLSYGLIKKNRIRIPINRIQAIRFTEGIFRQIWGYGTLYAESAGRGDQKEEGSLVLIPFMHKDAVNDLLETILPEYPLQAFSPEIRPPQRALRRYLQRALIPLLLIIPVLFLISVEYHWLFLLPVIGLALLGYAQYTYSGFLLQENNLVLFTRLLSKNIISLKRNRIQSFELKTTPFLERSDLWSFKILLASVQKNMAFGLSYLDVIDKGVLLDWLLKNKR